MIQPTELIPYARHDITSEDEAAVLGVLRSKWLTQGPKVEEFEALIAQESGAKFAVCVNSGTAALEFAIGLIHQRFGIRYCITSPISFVATANAAFQAGCRVGFVDVSPTSGWFTPRSSRLQADEPFIVVPVSLGGIAVEFPDSPVPVVGDACHSFGAAKLGRAEAVCFSFHAIKHIGCGEGGAVATNSEEFAVNLRMTRDHGRFTDRRCYKAGWNGRMPEMAAALGISQYQRLHAGIQRRRLIAQYYDAAFRGVEQLEPVVHGPGSARHLYSVLVEPTRRDAIRATLQSANIGTQVHYPAIHLQPFYRRYSGFKDGDFPGAEEYASRTLSIPMFPRLADAEVEYVAATVKRVVEECQ